MRPEVVPVLNQGEQLQLAPGFRFHPTDEELITHYLVPRALDLHFTCLVIADVDFNKCEPWDLPSMAKMGEKEWYFFWHRDRRYPTGMRINRATASGYWKATGRDKEIFRGDVLVGMKKTLVFYLGRAPSGKKTPWVMHEYRLEGNLPPQLPQDAKDEWAVCRVLNKELVAKQPAGQTAAPPATDPEELPPLIDNSDPQPGDVQPPAPALPGEAAGAVTASSPPYPYPDDLFTDSEWDRILGCSRMWDV